MKKNVKITNVTHFSVAHPSTVLELKFVFFSTKGDIHSLQRQTSSKDGRRERSECGFKGLTEGSMALERAI